MITEVGALVGIVKALLEAAKTGRELFGGSSKKATAESVRKTQERLAGIADQLFRAWLYQRCFRFGSRSTPRWTCTPTLSPTMR